MKHLQPKTLQIMVAVLTNPSFSQRIIRKICNGTNPISLGHVNKVIMDLERKGFVEPILNRSYFNSISNKKDEESKKGQASSRLTYRLSDPVGLLRYIAYFRSMKELRAFSVRVDATSEAVIEEMAKEGVIFCLGTAQARYSPYYGPDEISFYALDPERLLRIFSNASYGDNRIGCYRIDYVRTIQDRASLLDTRFAMTEGSISLTTKVQTVVDMFCDGKGAYAKPLLKELWGVQI